MLKNNLSAGKFVADKIVELLIKSSIPTFQLHSIENRILRLLKEWGKLDKFVGENRETETFQKKMIEFSRLFDVAACQCNLELSCNCATEFKVPLEEVKFLYDQRGERKIAIGGLDRNATKLLGKKRLNASQINKNNNAANGRYGNVSQTTSFSTNGDGTVLVDRVDTEEDLDDNSVDDTFDEYRPPIKLQIKRRRISKIELK